MIQRPEAHKARAACDAGKATKEATAEKRRLLAMMRCTYAGRGLHAFVIWALFWYSSQFEPQISLCKKKIHITLKYRHMHRVLHVDKIKN
jgi:hypothetical protein